MKALASRLGFFTVISLRWRLRPYFTDQVTGKAALSFLSGPNSPSFLRQGAG